jgi:hypothetical protein
MVSVQLDVDGRLRLMKVVPPQLDQSIGQPDAPDWSSLFAAARLDPAQFQPAGPQWTPLAATDARFAWTGSYPGRPDLPIRIEAASFHGQPVFFEIVFPWSKPTRMASTGLTRWQAANLLEQAVLALFSLGACFVAYYNWKASRGDLRGATRLAIYVAVLTFLEGMLGAHHRAAPAEQDLLGQALANGLFQGFLYWVVYLALEPWVRRYWPQSLISWSRLLAGRLRDPLVGRDALFAVALGLGYSLLVLAFMATLMRLGALGRIEFSPIRALLGMRPVLQSLSERLVDSILSALQIFLVLFVLRALLKKQWLAASLLVALFASLESWGQTDWYLELPFEILILSILVITLLRFGLLASAFAMFVVNFTVNTFLTLDFEAWYGQSSAIVLIVVVGLALWAFKLSLGDRPLFSPERRPAH